MVTTNFFMFAGVTGKESPPATSTFISAVGYGAPRVFFATSKSCPQCSCTDSDDKFVTGTDHEQH